MTLFPQKIKYGQNLVPSGNFCTPKKEDWQAA
jgi:hypothetical protein